MVHWNETLFISLISTELTLCVRAWGTDNQLTETERLSLIAAAVVGGH